MTEQQDLELEALLDGVWQRRRAELVERAGGLVTCAERAAQDPAVWDALAAEAHRLVGALGALGFCELAQAMRSVERTVAGSTGGPADVRAVRRAVGEVHAALLGATRRPRS